MSNRNWERLGNAALAVLIILVGVVYAMDAAKRYDEQRCARRALDRARTELRVGGELILEHP